MSEGRPYRDLKNVPITFEQWRVLKAQNPIQYNDIEIDGETITVCTQYAGIVGSVFKVTIDCDPKFDHYGHVKFLDSKQEAEVYTDMLKQSIIENKSVDIEQTKDAEATIFFEPKYNSFVVMDEKEGHRVGYFFDEKDKAEQKFAELKGNKETIKRKL